MKWASLAYGSAIGVAVALVLSVASTEFLKRQPDANLVNFAPAILGISIFGVNILAAAVALVTASVWLFRAAGNAALLVWRSASRSWVGGLRRCSIEQSQTAARAQRYVVVVNTLIIRPGACPRRPGYLRRSMSVIGCLQHSSWIQIPNRCKVTP